MATISSHVLNSVDGTHAGGVRVDCSRLADDGSAHQVFTVVSTEGGRISADIAVNAAHIGSVYELEFHLGDYFEANGLSEENRIVNTAVFRIKITDPDTAFHIPVIASPHGYSVWWSK
jgi:5-hydroxyisourate hydrolase